MNRRGLVSGATAVAVMAALRSARAQPLPPGLPARVLYVTAVSVGNGADTTEDTVQSYTLPANTLANVGDQLHIVVGGVPVNSADTKLFKLKFGGTNIIATNFVVSTATRIFLEMFVTKTGASTQAATGFSIGAANNVVQYRAAPNITDTAAIAILVTGQNTSTSTANTVNSDFFMVEYIRAPAA